MGSPTHLLLFSYCKVEFARSRRSPHLQSCCPFSEGRLCGLLLSPRHRFQGLPWGPTHGGQKDQAGKNQVCVYPWLGLKEEGKGVLEGSGFDGKKSQWWILQGYP